MLGPTYRFVTTVGSTVAADRNGTVHGPLVVSAGGDPTLTKAGLVALGRQLRARGIHAVTGGLQLDDSQLSRVRRAAGWKDEWVPGEVGPLSAFAVNGNSWRADAGYLANPSDRQPAGAAHGLRVRRRHRERAVDRRPRRRGPPHPLASVSSVPLSAIVHDMLKRSVNFDAEMLLEAVGARTGNATPAGGVAAVRAQAAALHVQLGGNIEDGSGLSSYDRATADGEVAWLEAAMTLDASAACSTQGCRSPASTEPWCAGSAAPRLPAGCTPRPAPSTACARSPASSPTPPVTG